MDGLLSALPWVKTQYQLITLKIYLYLKFDKLEYILVIMLLSVVCLVC